MRIFTLLIHVLFLYSCGNSQSLEDFREDGLAISRSLLVVLKQIRSDEELSAALPILSQHYDDLVNVMMMAHRWQELHPGTVLPPFTKEMVMLNASLSQELNRIYRLERGRLLMESAQEKSLQKLDAFLQQSKKQQSKKHRPPIK